VSCKWSFEGEIQLPSWRQTLFKIEKKREKRRRKKEENNNKNGEVISLYGKTSYLARLGTSVG